MSAERPPWLKAVPGLALAVLLALVADAIASIPAVDDAVHLSPLLIVIILGMVVASVVKLPLWTEAGVKVAQKPVLRWAVAGLGFRLSLGELVEIGYQALLVVALVVAAGYWAGIYLAKVLKLNDKLGTLLAVGGSICGASAIVAADAVVQADGKDAAVSLGTVTLWGTVGIFLYPFLAQLTGWSDFAYGVFCGATLHETAQVVAAASGMSAEAETTATVVKLARIVFLAPMVLLIGLQFRKAAGGEQGTKGKVPLVPWFLVLFVVFAAVHSFGGVPVQNAADEWINPAVRFLLAVGMAGVGLQTGWKDLRSAGWKPMVVGLGQWVVLAIVALIMMEALSIR